MGNIIFFQAVAYITQKNYPQIVLAIFLSFTTPLCLWPAWQKSSRTVQAPITVPLCPLDSFTISFGVQYNTHQLYPVISC